MANLIILANEEQQAFDNPPKLSIEERTACFTLSDNLFKTIDKLKTDTNKAGFLLQFGYFKAAQRFFTSNRFRTEDVDYVTKLLDIKKREVNLTHYIERIPAKHQEKILTILGYKSFKESTDWISEEIARQVGRQVEPKQILLTTLNLLHINRIEIPSYHKLTALITDSYQNFEQRLLKIIDKKLTNKISKKLDYLLKAKSEGSNKISVINRLKRIN